MSFEETDNLPADLPSGYCVLNFKRPVPSGYVKETYYLTQEQMDEYIDRLYGLNGYEKSFDSPPLPESALKSRHHVVEKPLRVGKKRKRKHKR